MVINYSKGGSISDILKLVTFIKEFYYYQLILVVGPSKSGKTYVLKEISKKLSVPIINLNLELSKHLLKIPKSTRILHLPEILEEICRKHKDIVLLDNTEVLFEPTLKQHPLELLKKLSRKRTVIATWNGKIKDNHLLYATPEHPSFKSCFLIPGEFLIVLLSKEESL